MGMHYLDRSCQFKKFNIFTLKFLFLDMYRKTPQIDIEPSDRTHCMLQMLPPPPRAAGTAYETIVEEHEIVQSKSFVGQKRPNLATSYLATSCDSLAKVLTAIANDDMFSRFRFYYDVGDDQTMPL